MKLYLGFENLPYTARYEASSPLPKSKSRLPKRPTQPQMSYGQGKTTLEVAQELEDKYHIVDTFYGIEGDFIVGLIQDAYTEAFDILLEHPEGAVSVKGTDRIEAKFRQNLSKQRYDGVIPGVPTTASLRGVSHLRRHPYAKRSPRPSFIDTGMYQRSFRAWIEEDE